MLVMMSGGWHRLRNEEEGEFSAEGDGGIDRIPSGRPFFRELLGCGKLEQQLMMSLTGEAAGVPFLVSGDGLLTLGWGGSLLAVGCHRLKTVGVPWGEEAVVALVVVGEGMDDAGGIRSGEMGEPAGVPDAGNNPH